MTGDELAPPGWYQDPQAADMQRYWDGTQWTEHRSPRQRVAESPAGWTWSGPRSRAHRNELVIGWVTAVVLPPIGLILGIRLMSSTDRQQAIGIVALSSLVLLLAIVSAVADGSSTLGA
jgi:hypothetical protein